MHSISTTSSTSPNVMLAGALVVLVLIGLRSWFILRAQPRRTSAGLGVFHVIRWAAALSCLAYVAYWLGR
jgi:hypothetical protein